MEHGSESKKNEGLWNAFIIGLLSAVLGGFIMMIIEYWTGWFATGGHIPESAILIILGSIIVFLVIEYKTSYIATRLKVPTLRSKTSDFRQRYSHRLSHFRREMKEVVGLLIPVLALLALFYLLVPGAPVTILVVLLALMIVLAERTIDPPMGIVADFLIGVGVIAAYVLLIHPPDLNVSIWPVPFTGDVSITNPRVGAYVLLLAFIFVVWVTSSMVAAHGRSTQQALRRDLDRFYKAASFEHILRAADEEKYCRIVIEWEQAIARLTKKDEDAAGFLGKCLPEKLEDWVLYLGSDDPTTLRLIEQKRHAPGKSRTLDNSFRETAERVFQEHFDIPYLTMQCWKMTKSEYETTKQRVEGVRNLSGERKE